VIEVNFIIDFVSN